METGEGERHLRDGLKHEFLPSATMCGTSALPAELLPVGGTCERKKEMRAREQERGEGSSETEKQRG